jgi:hypothetical protein
MRTASAILAIVLAAGLAMPSQAAALRKDFVASCQSQMMMSAPQCACMADKAEADLTERGILYLSLGATDVRNTAATAKAMTPAEMAAVDTFMKSAPGLCKGAK